MPEPTPSQPQEDAVSKVLVPSGTTDIPEDLWPAHVKMTADGATHWSSGPGNLTFDPDCPRCWFNTAHNLRAELAEATRREGVENRAAAAMAVDLSKAEQERDAALAQEKALHDALRGVFMRHYEPQFGGYCWCRQRSGVHEPHTEYCKQAKAALAAAPEVTS